MFSTIKSRLILLIMVIMAVTGGAVMFFTHKDVGTAMREAEESSAQNVLELIELNIRGEYNRLISDKIEILSRMKSELEQMTRVVGAVTRNYYELSDTGTVTYTEAQALTLRWIRSFTFGKGRAFVFDRSGRVIAASDPAIANTSLADVRDLKGRALLDSMNPDRLTERGDSAVFVWPRADGTSEGKNMGFFVPIKEWGWTIGGVIDFQNIEAESQKKLDAVLAVLKATFDKIQVAETGYVFLFDGRQRLLVPPPGAASQIDESHRRYLRALTDHTGKDAAPLRYNDPFSPQSVPTEAYVAYFKAFDWYIAVAVPVSEIQLPADALLARQSIIIGLVFLGALVAAWLIVARVSAPLNSLADYAKLLSMHDFTKRWEYDDANIKAIASDRDEFGRLAKAFLFMNQELRRNVRNAIESTAAKERLEREAAVEAARAKDEFLANMSHEIRTPIHGILGITELLLSAPLDDKQQRLTRTIKSTGQTLLSIINDILDFSKIEAYKLELENTDFRLDDLVERVAEQFAEQAQRKRIEFVCWVAPECSGTFRGDPARIRQVLVNLVGNAVKFTREGEISVRVLLTGQVGPHCQVRFEVKDTGIGMSESVQARVFDPFSQADNSTTRRYGGTGLGLAICSRLVSLMHGQIGVDSSLEEGSRFWFTAGLAKVASADEPQAEGPAPQYVSRALVVHANETSRQVFLERLTAMSIDTTAVAGSTEALDCLARAVEQGRRYEVAIIDAHPVGLSGVELAERLLRESRLGRPRCHLMVNVVGDEALEESAKALKLHCLPKPVQLEAIRRAVLADDEEAVQQANAAEHERSGEWEGVLRGRILVAEDNELNRMLTVEMLKRTECQLVLAVDGKDALARFASQDFDLVLMDCQMPEMDGFDATREIRKMEAETMPQRRVPIVALTANAMRGDREECLAAGMDDYLSKPFSARELLELVGRWVNHDHAGEKVPPRRAPAAEPAGQLEAPEVDEALAASALENIRAVDDGESELLARCINAFLDSAPQAVADLESAVERGDNELLHRTAHSLKSNSANLGAMVLSRTAKTLEQNVRKGEIADARELVNALKVQTEQAVVLLERELASEGVKFRRSA